jgi:hypothetical protein
MVALWQLCPKLFGIPQTRPRLYFLAINGIVAESINMTKEQTLAFLHTCMENLVGSSSGNTINNTEKSP